MNLKTYFGQMYRVNQMNRMIRIQIKILYMIIGYLKKAKKHGIAVTSYTIYNLDQQLLAWVRST